MTATDNQHNARRYKNSTQRKANGVTYTPTRLANFVSHQITCAYKPPQNAKSICILDPALGDGELLVSLVALLRQKYPDLKLECYAFDTDSDAICRAKERLGQFGDSVVTDFKCEDFVSYMCSEGGVKRDLFNQQEPRQFDLVIANPPYVRTQILGAVRAQELAKVFSLRGRVDLYYVFLLVISASLKCDGIAGIIVSNRFMTTRSGASVRSKLLEQFQILHVWDFGDTKLFDAAVLPAVLLLANALVPSSQQPKLSSIYESSQAPSLYSQEPISALSHEGIVEVEDGRRFEVRHGALKTNHDTSGVWTIGTKQGDRFLATTLDYTWGTFRDLGKVRVGVKTCADSIFIRSDWNELDAFDAPELLRPLITHHVARRFRADSGASARKILYPHESLDRKRQPVDLSQYSRTRRYLEAHRNALEKRTYVTKAGRKWYELWVPQNPADWECPKVVFRDISERPTFWMDLKGSIVNGDCYWLKCDTPSQEHLLWLVLCVANSSFIEKFYDYKFNNKLYSGRRRFITQYVEQFPLPDPDRSISHKMMKMAHQIFESPRYAETEHLQKHLNSMVWEAFGLSEEAFG